MCESLKSGKKDNLLPESGSRREMLKSLGIGTIGMLMSPFLFGNGMFFGSGGRQGTTKVAATQTNSYLRHIIRQKVQHLFEALGGIDDIIKPGDKVGIKINLTGGSGWANHSQLQGVDIRECAWTHPEVLRAVGELLVDSGISGNDIYLVEALWDMNSYNLFGYLDVQQQLGANLVNLNSPSPYPDFVHVPTGNQPFYYNTIILNPILEELDAYISIPKMKHHWEAGMTHSMKNQVGIVPLAHYQMPNGSGIRSKLHYEGGEIGYHLPRSICDLDMARAVTLAIIDGVKNAVGGEGPWNQLFTPAAYNLLLAGKDAVATDSIASMVMGQNPENEHFERPPGGFCDNHLFLANQKGMGTNKLQDIELVGDGAGGIFGIDDISVSNRQQIQLYQNYPNPFNGTTTFDIYLPEPEIITISIISVSGQVIEEIAEGHFDRGKHEFSWNSGNLPAGPYFFQLKAKGYTQMRKMIKGE